MRKLLSLAIKPPLWFVVLTVTGAAMTLVAFVWFGVSGEFDSASLLLRVSSIVAVLSGLNAARMVVGRYFRIVVEQSNRP